MVYDRNPSLFADRYICAIWVNLYQLFTKMSIALTATLSISRTWLIISPFSFIHKKRIFIGLGCYATFVLLMTAIPCLVGLQYTTYDKSGGYCWMVPSRISGVAKIWGVIDDTVDNIALAGPLVPIGVSCMISIYKMLIDRNNAITEHVNVQILNIKWRATFTIIIFTAVYLFFNLPLFICYFLWIVTWIKYTYPGPFFGSSAVMYNYAWNYVEVLSVSLNSMCNPMIYFWRFRRFRVFTLRRQMTANNVYRHQRIRQRVTTPN